MPVIPASGRLRQEGCESETNMSFEERGAREEGDSFWESQMVILGRGQSLHDE